MVESSSSHSSTRTNGRLVSLALEAADTFSDNSAHATQAYLKNEGREPGHHSPHYCKEMSDLWDPEEILLQEQLQAHPEQEQSNSKTKERRLPQLELLLNRPIKTTQASCAPSSSSSSMRRSRSDPKIQQLNGSAQLFGNLTQLFKASFKSVPPMPQTSTDWSGNGGQEKEQELVNSNCSDEENNKDHKRNPVDEPEDDNVTKDPHSDLSTSNSKGDCLASAYHIQHSRMSAVSCRPTNLARRRSVHRRRSFNRLMSQDLVNGDSHMPPPMTKKRSSSVQRTIPCDIKEDQSSSTRRSRSSRAMRGTRSREPCEETTTRRSSSNRSLRASRQSITPDHDWSKSATVSNRDHVDETGQLSRRNRSCHDRCSKPGRNLTATVARTKSSSGIRNFPKTPSVRNLVIPLRRASTHEGIMTSTDSIKCRSFHDRSSKPGRDLTAAVTSNKRSSCTRDIPKTQSVRNLAVPLSQTSTQEALVTPTESNRCGDMKDKQSTLDKSTPPLKRSSTHIGIVTGGGGRTLPVRTSVIHDIARNDVSLEGAKRISQNSGASTVRRVSSHNGILNTRARRRSSRTSLHNPAGERYPLKNATWLPKAPTDNNVLLSSRISIESASPEATCRPGAASRKPHGTESNRLATPGFRRASTHEGITRYHKTKIPSEANDGIMVEHLGNAVSTVPPSLLSTPAFDHAGKESDVEFFDKDILVELLSLSPLFTDPTSLKRCHSDGAKTGKTLHDEKTEKRKSKEGKKSRRKGLSNSRASRSAGALGLLIAEARGGTSKPKEKTQSTTDAFGLKFDQWLTSKKNAPPSLPKPMSNATFPIIDRNDTRFSCDKYKSAVVVQWLSADQLSSSESSSQKV